MEKPKMVRLNTRISSVAHDWLERESIRTGVPKSTLMYLALETYISQQNSITALMEISNKLEDLSTKIDKIETN